MTDAYVQQLLLINPMPALVAFYFEKCVLTEEVKLKCHCPNSNRKQLAFFQIWIVESLIEIFQSFFLLVNRLPSLRFLGILSE